MDNLRSNSHLLKLKSYEPGKTEAEIRRRYHLKHVIKLASNENPLGMSKNALLAATQSLQEAHRYPEDAAPELKEKLKEKWGVDTQQITLGAGSSELIEMLMRAFVDDENSEVILPTHSFILYRLVAQALGASVKLIDEIDWQPNLKAMQEAISSRTKVIIIANPNNPTGIWIDHHLLSDFILSVPKRVLIILDEAYCDYMQEPNYASMTQLIEQHPNLVTLHTFSKIHGLAGLRVGYGISAPFIAETLQKLRKPFNVSSVGLSAALAALEDTNFIEKSLESNRAGLHYLKSEFSKLNLPCITKSANFLTVHAGKKSHEIAEILLKKGIIIRELLPYNMPNYLRITVGTMEENEVFIQTLSSLEPIEAKQRLRS